MLYNTLRFCFAFLCLALIIACEQESLNDNTSLEFKKNRLDNILGEKKFQNGNIRPDNFYLFHTLDKSDVNSYSQLYSVDQISENIYLLQQKKVYDSARVFTALLKFDKDSVVNFVIFDDLKCKDYVVHDSKLTFLLGNFGIFNAWESKNKLLLFTMNHQLKPTWRYAISHPNYNINPHALSFENGNYQLTCNLITGCDICYDQFQINLSVTGEYLSHYYITSINSTHHLSVVVEEEIFKQETVYR